MERREQFYGILKQLEENQMKINAKTAAKVAGATCVATGVVALSALVASGATVGAVVEGFVSAKNTMKRLLADETGKEASGDVQQSDDSAEDNASEIKGTPEEILNNSMISYNK